jgi:hypothetical protein
MSSINAAEESPEVTLCCALAVDSKSKGDIGLPSIGQPASHDPPNFLFLRTSGTAEKRRSAELSADMKLSRHERIQLEPNMDNVSA